MNIFISCTSDNREHIEGVMLELLMGEEVTEHVVGIDPHGKSEHILRWCSDNNAQTMYPIDLDDSVPLERNLSAAGWMGMHVVIGAPSDSIKQLVAMVMDMNSPLMFIPDLNNV